MTESTASGELRVGIIGTAFMGAAHSHAWATAPKFFDLPRHPVLQVMVGRDAERTQATADRFGWQETATDWRSLLDRDDIDLIDVCTPGDSHEEIAVAALAAGKHVLCEKPVVAVAALLAVGPAGRAATPAPLKAAVVAGSLSGLPRERSRGNVFPPALPFPELGRGLSKACAVLKA